jgi:ketosteroid isomerase-like protein
MDPVRQFVDAFNRNDVEGMQAACAETTSIIDDFPPHEWSGPQATTSWYVEMAQMAPGFGMSEWSVTLGEPRHLEASDGCAYVAVPADVRWLQDGTPSERACMMTLALRETADGWRISALAWAWS